MRTLSARKVNNKQQIIMSKTIYKDELGEIVKYAHDKFGGEGHYAIFNKHGICVNIIPSRVFYGRPYDIVRKYV